MDRSILIKKYFEEKKFVDSSIHSFNNFLERGMQEVVEENIEADGSKRPIFPMEARLRKISYHAPIKLEVSTYINDVQRENFVAEVGKMPIMLKSKYCNLDRLNRE